MKNSIKKLAAMVMVLGTLSATGTAIARPRHMPPPQHHGIHHRGGDNWRKPGPIHTREPQQHDRREDFERPHRQNKHERHEGYGNGRRNRNYEEDYDEE